MSELLTTKELATYLKVDPSTLWRWREKGLPYMKIGNNSIRYDKSKVLEWVGKNARLD